MIPFEFPVGYHRLHKTKIIDFQLNRWHSLGYARLKDMQSAAGSIHSLDDFKGALLAEAERALAEGRRLNGTFYIRAAEFFTSGYDPDKAALYERFLDLFYNELFPDVERVRIPFEGGFLPAFSLPTRGERRGPPLVIHGGFDSFIEEFIAPAAFFANLGYPVYLFEGPGQGGARRLANLPFDHAWEKPAAAVLDHYGLDDVTWLGISMGGWLCFRAAAFEPRIARVIASSISFDYMQIPPPAVAGFARWLLTKPGLMNWMAGLKMKMMPQERWGVENLMFITQAPTPLEASLAMVALNESNQHPDRVRQDVLILTGEEDHFIPVKLHHLQLAALRNARSVTGRIFTRAEEAHNHCQIGNFGLALDVMAGWIEEKTEERVLAAG